MTSPDSQAHVQSTSYARDLLVSTETYLVSWIVREKLVLASIPRILFFDDGLFRNH